MGGNKLPDFGTVLRVINDDEGIRYLVRWDNGLTFSRDEEFLEDEGAYRRGRLSEMFGGIDEE